MTARGDLLVSIVSHGHGTLVAQLLRDLRQLDCRFRCALTLNVPEDESFLHGMDDVVHHIVRNARPRGFGANHNAAFSAHTPCAQFLVLNPDARMPGFDFDPLLQALGEADVGLVAPLVYSSNGVPEDSVRSFPTVWGLVRRRLTGRTKDVRHFRPGDAAQQVEWVAGMFMLFRGEAFAAVHGFDERYFMYLEDVDVCRRLAKRGWSTWVVPAVGIIHDARRASRRNLRHLAWHMRSAIRYFGGF